MAETTRPPAGAGGLDRLGLQAHQAHQALDLLPGVRLLLAPAGILAATAPRQHHVIQDEVPRRMRGLG